MSTSYAWPRQTEFFVSSQSRLTGSLTAALHIVQPCRAAQSQSQGWAKEEGGGNSLCCCIHCSKIAQYIYRSLFLKYPHSAAFAETQPDYFSHGKCQSTACTPEYAMNLEHGPRGDPRQRIRTRTKLQTKKAPFPQLRKSPEADARETSANK